MNHAEHNERHGRALEHTTEIDHFDELIAAELGERFEILCKALLVPCSDFLRSFHVFRKCRGVHVKDAVDHRFQEAILGDGDVPDEFDSAFGDRIRPVLAFVGGHGFQHFLGDSAFIFQ